MGNTTQIQAKKQPAPKNDRKLGDWTPVDHERCNGGQERCKRLCDGCTSLFCKCACCPPRRGIIIFFGIIMVLIVIGLIMYFLAWTSIPDFETFRNYWKNGMPSTHFKK